MGTYLNPMMLFLINTAERTCKQCMMIVDEWNKGAPVGNRKHCCIIQKV